MTAGTPLARFPVHLGRGASAVVEPEFTGMDWYAAYGERHAPDGAEGRLVSLFRFAADWDSCEMHPAGDEVVVCTRGAFELVQQLPDGAERRIPIGEGEYAINPAGVWHTADVAGEAEALFITAGLGTQHRPR